MKSLSDITACVVDNGLFVPLALKLAQTYKRVLYMTNCKKGFANLNERIIGDGYAEVERIKDFWPIKRDIDLFIFPDIEDSGLQLELESQGFPVWGSRTGDSYEMNRELFMKTLSELDLEVPNFTKVTGLTELSEHLLDKEDKYLKISEYRGTMETFHWRSWREDEGFLDSMAVKLGPAKELLPFLVFDAIETDLEIGGDTYCVDGQFPSLMVNGLEWKDKGYLGAVTKREDMPEHIQQVMEAFAPLLKNAGYKNAWSIELRVKDDKAYPTDPCHRFPCPANGAQMELLTNQPEIIWAGAHGELVEAEMGDDFAAECVLTSKSEKHSWGVVDFPKELRPHIKCGGSCEIDGRICFPPDDSHGDEIGWLVATGDSIESVADTMKEYAALLPDGVSANTQSLFDLLKEAHSAEEQGIEFGDDKIPEPEIALDNGE